MMMKRFKMPDPWLVLLTAVSLIWAPELLSAGLVGERPDEEKVVQVYRDVVPATVFLSSSYTSGSGRNASIGSGFIVDEAGTVLTNAHVVEGAHTVMAKLYDGQRVRAEVLGVDSYSDVAALRLTGVKGKIPFVQLGTSDALRIGQRALLVGNPFGLGFGLSTGILSGLNRLPPGVAFSEPRVPLIQTTAPINPGDSGGPLINSDGRVIGITTAMVLGTQNIGFAVPIDLAKEVLGELKAQGKVSRPWLGVGGKFVTEEIRELFVLPLADGLLVGEVFPGSPAADGGLRAGTVDVTVDSEPWNMGGDLIVSIQGRSLRTMEEFISAFKDLKIGETVSVEFIRDRMRRRTSLVVAERPQGLSHLTSMPIGKAARSWTQAP